MTAEAQALHAARRTKRRSPARWGLYAFIFITALYFLLPLYVMVVTSLKPMAEIRQGNLLALPAAPSIDAWVKAWTSACTGLTCQGIKIGFLNSLRILVPSVAISILIGSLTGYALSLWRVRGANILFGAMMVVAFIPYQVFRIAAGRVVQGRPRRRRRLLPDLCADHDADGHSHDRGRGDLADHRHLERFHPGPRLRRPRQSTDDGAAQ
jgi:ABC-type glycerol-3-phosphate transport system permease component